MSKASEPQLSNLDRVTATIVHEMGEVGLYHYNKLTYLFEYFYIKNFASRYTKEQFPKLPHGPVISNYKRQIRDLHGLNVIKTDLDELKRYRKMDDYHGEILIECVPNTKIYMVSEEIVYSLIVQIVQKFGAMSTAELEEVVYRTTPLINFQNNPYKLKKGGYVLAGDCIKMKDYKNSVTEGRKLAIKHLQKYPEVDEELQLKLAKELQYLEALRPEI